jgi:hypothetical protein
VRSGDNVQLRSPSEILATLDENGLLGGVPFMPEMLAYFGRSYTVDAKVLRACDTISYTGVRELEDTVLLEDLRCSGSGHSLCQAQCRIYWKEAWLRPAEAASLLVDPRTDPRYHELARQAARGAVAPNSTPDEPRYRCQATELLRAGKQIGYWSPRSLIREVQAGNVTILRFIRVMSRVLVEEIARKLGLVTLLPYRPEELKGQKSAMPQLHGLKPGDLVQIRGSREIGRTLNENGTHRGLWFDREMKVHCGRTARVKTKVERFIDEGSGKMIELASDAYILDDVVCEGDRSSGRWLCPRAIYPWWRETWLQPLDAEASTTPLPRVQEAQTP